MPSKIHQWEKNKGLPMLTLTCTCSKVKGDLKTLTEKQMEKSCLSLGKIKLIIACNFGASKIGKANLFL
jgi:hypothetical protein